MVTNSVELSAQRMPSTAKPQKKSRTRRLCTTKSTEQYGKSAGKHGVERRTVLQCRYLDTMAWQDVAYLVFGDRTDYSDKFDSFQRRVFNIHKAALEDLAQVLDL